MRFAIWIAVSSKPQAKGWDPTRKLDDRAAEDLNLDTKDSLPEQERRCRTTGRSKRWVDSGLVYAAPGVSRTRWVNLRDAEQVIPDLHKMLEDARAGLFDVLVLYDYNRLRDLQDSVAKALNAYGVQLYSVNQGAEPAPVDEFRQRRYSDAESTMRGVSQITSRAQINDLRRKHEMTTKGRVERGLHPSNFVPYGYIKQQKAAPTLDPVKAEALRKMKDLYLSGQTVTQIIEWLAANQISSPRGHARWTDYPVRYALRNPFYAGKVFLGRWRRVDDPRLDGRPRMVKGDPSAIMWNGGVHEPLWDEATYFAILDEMKRRTKVHKGPRTYRLSNLLRCGVHESPLRVHYLSGVHEDRKRVWYCPAVKHKWHLHMRDAELLEAISSRLVQDLRRIGSAIEPAPREDRQPAIQQAIEALQARRNRLLDALESGSLDAVTYADRTKGLDGQLAKLQDDLATEQLRISTRKGRRDAMAQLAHALDAVPHFIREAPAQAANAQLRELIEKITVGEDGDLEISYRV